VVSKANLGLALAGVASSQTPLGTPVAPLLAVTEAGGQGGIHARIAQAPLRLHMRSLMEPSLPDLV